MQDWLIQFSTNHSLIVYAVIVVIAVAEGPILSILCGVLVHLGFLTFLPSYLAVMLGDIIGDVVWYGVGMFWGHKFIKRFGKFFHITDEGLTKAIDFFHKHRRSVLLVSKMTNGFGFALVTLIAAGTARIPFKEYLSLNIVGQIIWSGLLLFTGYFFGRFYSFVESLFGVMGGVAAVAFTALVFYGIYRFIQSKVMKQVNEA